ncbi:hypothetical protein JYK14_01215 [Siccirubricoccus sp. KC 17139]|uniref:Uncharacterized protein n=1 Tax=Siccirubricoccus soli TaxID=2899147 RepID=A0ABT1CYQ7_9PROT|nr:hypothetical protein [Siccirubricoccus soli]MCO6414800.1 hypothetical protein [Siccirubricoccus soli]MCP2680930.1 hypothetical protein [Siccirubricoccus soli]
MNYGSLPASGLAEWSREPLASGDKLHYGCVITSMVMGTMERNETMTAADFVHSVYDACHFTITYTIASGPSRPRDQNLALMNAREKIWDMRNGVGIEIPADQQENSSQMSVWQMQFNALRDDEWLQDRVGHLPVSEEFHERLLAHWPSLAPKFAIRNIAQLLVAASLALPYFTFKENIRQSTITEEAKGGASVAGRTYFEIPAADRFVRLDHNRPAVDEAREKLEELANEVQKSNTLPLSTDERAALVAEIRTLAAMLSERVIRLAQVQFAISEAGVLGYLKGSFAGDVRAAVVGAAVTALLAAVGMKL